MISIVLYRPEIPPNTGNIGRLSLGTDSKLIIVGNPSFKLDSHTATKRAGLDYWENVTLDRYENWSAYKQNTCGQRIIVTKYATVPYSAKSFEPGTHLVFGGETRGLPEHIHTDPETESICIPMTEHIRSYNLANSTAIVLFEALRQIHPDWFQRTPYSGNSPPSDPV